MEQKKSKKADITTQQIVLLIILIASFAVILFFIFRLNLGKTSAKEVCYNSVITRSSAVLPQDAIPLNCQTSYICISKDGTCEKMSGSREIKKVKTEDDIYNLLANEMADCWWMFGEGKVNYIGKEFIADRYCSICTQISFDDSIKEISDTGGSKIFANGEIDKKKLYEYLAKTNISDKKMSYLDYLTGVQDVKKIEESLASGNANFGKIYLDRHYAIVMGIASKVSAEGWAAAGAAAGTAVFPIVGTIIGGVVGYFGGPMIGTAIHGEAGNVYLSPTIIEADSEEYNSLQCASIKTLA